MTEKIIFVFGSNLAGKHGAGAALTARLQHGAIYGRGWGLQGNSWGIPTKDWELKTLPLERIRPYVEELFNFARTRPTWRFYITRVGCGLAGYTTEQMAPLFQGAPQNCDLPPGWVKFLNKGVNNVGQLSPNLQQA